MAMTIMNDASASMTLGELNKNISALGKQLKKVSSGQRINGAGDGPSEYSISEKMRVRIRALDQDERNVLNGAALLKTAEGAIQQQIEIMKTIKEKVIDADNDTNTDIDRMTIQKEIDHGYQQIQDIAYETNYNGKRLLVGDTKVDEIYTWKVVAPPETTPGSEMDIIPDTVYGLDDVQDWFDPLQRYSEDPENAKISPLFGSESKVSLSGGGSTPSSFIMDFSGYTLKDLDGLGFRTAGDPRYASYYVLTRNSSGNDYRVNTAAESQPPTYKLATEIDIGSAGSVADALKILAESTQLANVEKKDVYNPSTHSTRYMGTGTVIDGNKIKFNRNSTQDSSTPLFVGWDAVKTETELKNAEASGVTVLPQQTGTPDRQGEPTIDPATDLPVSHTIPGTPTTLTLQNVSSAAVGSGFTVNNSYGGGKLYIRFVEGSEGLKFQDDGSYTVGRNATVLKTNVSTKTSASSGSLSTYIFFSMSNGQITLTSTQNGAYNLTLTDGVNRGTPPNNVWKYQEVSALDNDRVTPPQGGNAGNAASYEIDLSAYDTTDGLDDFINELKGKAITFQHYSPSNYDPSVLNKDSYPNAKYEFVDRAKPESMDALVKTSYFRYSQNYKATAIDLNLLRTEVEDHGKTIASAFIELMTSSGIAGSGANKRFSSEPGSNILKVNASYSGVNSAEGNNEKIEISAGTLGQNTVDFKSYFENTGTGIPEGLDGKGFRIYCATCQNQWFNFQFSAGSEELDDTRPISGSSGADLKTVNIDISDIDNVDDLVKRFYEKANEAMKTIMKGDEHTLGVTADYENGTVTFYDTRRFPLKKGSGTGQFPYVAKETAKLADGVLDDVQKELRGIYVKDLVIHHTDHASQNIHVRIPQTTLDHLFNYIEGTRSISEFNVMTTKSREELLGNVKGERRTGGYTDHEEKGALDTALDYLTSANTLIGAQIMRLEMTQTNIVTSRESTTNSESTIRDADMAKEMTGYTKANVLAQAAQSMLAQANQNSSGILNLLQ